MLKVIDYIRSNGLDALKENFGIEVREYPDRIVLNYNQIESPKFDPIVRECRGLILSYPALEILSITFGRFFNYGEDPLSDQFDVSEAVAYEKVDGSLLHVYHDGVQWNVATRGTAYAEGETRLEGFTFADVFEMALGVPVGTAFSIMPTQKVYVFELTSPYSRVVKPYELGIYPLIIKDKTTLQEICDQEEIKKQLQQLYFPDGVTPAIRYAKIYPFSSFDEVLESMKELNSFDEGYVCVRKHHHGDGYHWRLKVKSPQYLAIAHLRGNGVLSTKRVISLVFLNEYDEYLATFEEDRVFFQPYIDAFTRMVEDIHKVYDSVKNIQDQKEFALKVKDHPCSGVLFRLRKGDSISKIFDACSDKNKESMINHYKV
jgi:hypothetical protein